MAKTLRILEIIVYIFLIVFSIFIIYQLILKILGGSWETQDIKKMLDAFLGCSGK